MSPESSNLIPRFSRWLIEKTCPYYSDSSAVLDLEEEFLLLVEENKLSKARRWYRRQAAKSVLPYLKFIVYWRLTMLKNYLTIAKRNLVKHKGFSLINILGLAVGLACCIFIFLYVQFQMSYDDYHQGIDRTFIVGLDSQGEGGQSRSLGNMAMTIPTLRERYPQVEAAVRLNEGWIIQVSAGDLVFKEQELWHADPDIFQILSIPFEKGDPRTALDRPNTVVMTNQMACKYFNEIDPLGKTLTIGDTEYEVTGIVKDSPLNTVYNYKMIMSWATIQDDEHYSQWGAGIRATHCMIRLKEGIDRSEFEDDIREIPHEYLAEELEKMGATYRYFLFPLRDIHFTSFAGGVEKPSPHQTYAAVFSIVGILILLIACMNFMNLATARSAKRAAEVGMRKVVGAQRRHIIGQFLGESFFIVMLSFMLSLVLVNILIPVFNDIAGTDFSSMKLVQPVSLGIFFILLVVVALLAGSYPAFVLSSFRPIAVLRSTLSANGRGRWLRRVLVVSQFGISIALLIATLTVHRQVHFMKNQPLGFDKEQKIVITTKTWRMLTESYEMVKSEFLRHPSVLNATAASGVPGSMINRTYYFPQGKQAEMGMAFRSLRSDHDFLKVYGVGLLAGRHFDKTISTDTYSAVIINETGAKAWGWRPEEVIGQRLGDGSRVIVGVVKDFHWWGLQRDIEPLVVRVVPDLFRAITLTVKTENLSETMAFLKEKYQELFPGDVFDTFFVDANFDLQYRSEERLGRVFQIFTVLGCFIACLGLFGMASFIAEQRIKEIGIRKVLGAPANSILLLLSASFIKWVIVANIIAWPAAYFAGEAWLRNFAYRSDLGWEVFVVSTLLAIVIALSTVSFQAIRAASANPVDALKYE